MRRAPSTRSTWPSAKSFVYVYGLSKAEAWSVARALGWTGLEYKDYVAVRKKRIEWTFFRTSFEATGLSETKAVLLSDH